MIKQTWKMAWSAVCSNKMRTVLTMLGIIIGIAALIVLVSIADGATTSVSSQISSIGSNYLTVQVLDDKENPLRLSEFSELFEDGCFISKPNKKDVLVFDAGTFDKSEVEDIVKDLYEKGGELEVKEIEVEKTIPQDRC